jgi:ornithine--oxo-acid transaminase
MSSLSKKLISKIELYGAHNYNPLPVVLKKAKGSKVWDVEGKEYIDFLSCYSALNFGHQHPRLVKALEKQLHEIALCSRAFYSEALCEFSEKLAKFCGLEMVLPMNSGAEAVETAIKIARKWATEVRKIPVDKGKILVLANNFHGRTITILSFSTEEDYRGGFGPFTPGFEVIPFGDLKAMEKAIDKNTFAILAEPIQAEAGILLPPPGYIAGLKALCEKNQMLLILDEIQTGLGRTGKDFCFQYDGIKPDLLVLGKSLGGGLVPISAVVGNRKVMEIIRPGQHGSTFGGNPLACALANEALDILREEKLSERAQWIGEEVLKTLRKKTLPKVKEIRGRGALIGIELEESSGGARRYCEKLAEEGVLCKETHTHVIRIAPPLNIESSDLQVGLSKIIHVISSS